MIPHSSDTRFHDLLNGWIDGVISDAEIRELNALLREDRQRVKFFAHRVHLHHLAREVFAMDRENVPPVNVASLRPPQRRKFWWSLLAVGLACFVMTAIILGPFSSSWQQVAQTEPSPVSAPSPVHESSHRKSGETTALLSRSANVEWTSTGRRWSVGDRVGLNDIVALQAGRVELVFDNETILVLLGPAELEVRAADLVLLHSGTVTARIDSTKGQNFRVLTPTSEVLDLGTEFGVRVDENKETEVVVFDGAVDLTPSIPQTENRMASHRLSVGEAARVNRSGQLERIVSINDDAFPFGDRLFPPTRRRPPIITKVTDDRRDPNSPKYYRIYHEGLQEDARAYVDRPHEWNGVTEEGIPHFLRGADYVATFNDDKLDCPSITVHLSQPAILYVFHDDRMASPKWLTESFENTGFKIGLDEGPYSRRESRKTSISPGISIDAIHSVWKRVVRGPESIVLGGTGKRVHGASMYGIAAQPFDHRDD